MDWDSVQLARPQSMGTGGDAYKHGEVGEACGRSGTNDNSLALSRLMHGVPGV